MKCLRCEDKAVMRDWCVACWRVREFGPEKVEESITEEVIEYDGRDSEDTE